MRNERVKRLCFCRVALDVLALAGESETATRVSLVRVQLGESSLTVFCGVFSLQNSVTVSSPGAQLWAMS